MVNIKALEAFDILVKAVSGASLGAVVVALLVNGYDSKEMLELFAHYNNILIKGAILLGECGSVVIE